MLRSCWSISSFSCLSCSTSCKKRKQLIVTISIEQKLNVNRARAGCDMSCHFLHYRRGCQTDQTKIFSTNNDNYVIKSYFLLQLYNPKERNKNKVRVLGTFAINSDFMTPNMLLNYHIRFNQHRHRCREVYNVENETILVEISWCSNRSRQFKNYVDCQKSKLCLLSWSIH